MKETIRILIVDGRELVRYGLRHILTAEEDMKVVRDYSSVNEAVSEIDSLIYDIVLMGAQMPEMNLMKAIRSLKKDWPIHGDIIILAESADCKAEALEAGAASYLHKDIARIELVQTIRQVYRERHSLKEGEGLVQETVELVVPHPANAAQLLRFMCQLGEVFHEDFASIICTTGTWDRNTVITVQLQPAMFASLLIQLTNMPEVEKIEEETLARGVFSSFANKFGLLPRLGINPSKRLRVTLKEPGIARQELMPVSA